MEKIKPWHERLVPGLGWCEANHQPAMIAEINELRAAVAGRGSFQLVGYVTESAMAKLRTGCDANGVDIVPDKISIWNVALYIKEPK